MRPSLCCLGMWWMKRGGQYSAWSFRRGESCWNWRIRTVEILLQAYETPLLGPAAPRTPASFLSARDDRLGTWPYNVFDHLGLSSVVVVLMLGLCDITERACSLVVSVVPGNLSRREPSKFGDNWVSCWRKASL